jgi:predicted phosphodiesterase
MKLAPIAHICDVHVPDHDPALWSSFLAWCRDEQPGEIIIGGDFLELESCSQHGGVARPAHLVEEIKAGRAALAELRKANPKARITYLEGNHETRLSRKVINDLPELDGALSLPEMLDLKGLRIGWHPYGEIVTRGKMGFTHGWWSPQFHAAKHLREIAANVAFGHVHRYQVHTRGVADGDVQIAIGQPCMRKLDAEWLDGRPTGWSQGFGIFYLRPDDIVHAYTALWVRDGLVAPGGKFYGAPRARKRKAA